MLRQIVILAFFFWMSLSVSAQARPFVIVSVDNENPYEGNALVYSLKLFAQDIINGDSIVIEPDFVGFGRSSVIFEPIAYTEVFEGVNYNVIEQNYLLYPLRPGELTIDPLQIDIPATPFDPAWTLYSDSVTINVQELPEPAPAEFLNAVGQFDIQGNATPTEVHSGEAVSVSLTISGAGNVEQVLAPEIDLPSGWRILEQSSDFQQDSLRFGTKSFQWLIVVSGDGSATVPAIEFSYFNPQNGQYESRSTAPVNLEILPATVEAEVVFTQTAIITEDDNLPELLEGQLIAIAPEPPAWFWYLWIIPPLITLIVWLVSRPGRENQRTKKPRKTSGSRALRELSSTLEKTESLEPKEAYTSIAVAVYLYLGRKTGETVNSNTFQEAISEFAETERQRLISCIEEANSGQYAPVNTNDVKQLIQQVLSVCQAIEGSKK